MINVYFKRSARAREHVAVPVAVHVGELSVSVEKFCCRDKILTQPQTARGSTASNLCVTC